MAPRSPSPGAIRSAALILGLFGAVACLPAEEPAPARAPGRPMRKPTMDDTIRGEVYADNWFMLWINGELVAVDPIRFIPHNVVSIDLLPSYPMTIAVLAKDNFDPKTGMEYANTNVGDAGFVLKFADGTVTDASWKARCVSRGPVGGDTKNPRVEEEPLPEDWFAVGFDDSGWGKAREYSEEEVGPKQPYYDADFAGARFIWSDDLAIDNVVAFRKVVTAPPDGRAREDFTGLNDVVPEGPPKRPGGKGPDGRGPGGKQGRRGQQERPRPENR